MAQPDQPRKEECIQPVQAEGSDEEAGHGLEQPPALPGSPHAGTVPASRDAAAQRDQGARP